MTDDRYMTVDKMEMALVLGAVAALAHQAGREDLGTSPIGNILRRWAEECGVDENHIQALLGHNG